MTTWDRFTEWLADTWTIILVVAAAASIKLLDPEYDPPENETRQHRRARRRRMWSGLVSGLLVCGTATRPLAEIAGLGEWAVPMIAGALFFAGEHIVQRLLRPQRLLDRLINRYVGGSDE